ncbi:MULTISPECIES: hypothetical protein [unclassified Microcoleus]|uniref:hypothetical protein n=1 Tax=unclassified Microcoleus TaxID=2642155 RepID=UPI002FD3BFA7
MSIPKKGTRKIIVDGEPFVWLIRRQATNIQAESGCGNLHVAVEHAEESGGVLVIRTDRPHPQGWSRTNCEFIPIKPAEGAPPEVKVWQIISTQEVKPVKPSDVAQWIRQAMQLGWQPTRSGIPFQLQIAGGRAEKIY